jgi:HNH endonuclease
MLIIDEPLLGYFRSKRVCELCRQPPREGERLQPHHVHARGMGGGSRLDTPLNLLALCGRCHSLVHQSTDEKLRCREVVAYREGLLVAQVEEAIWRLLRRSKEHQQPWSA